MKLTPVESGWMSCATEMMCEGGCEGEGERVRFPVSCWVIEHGSDLVLFDTGMHADLQTSTERIGLAATIFDIEMQGSLTSQLAKQGISAADITIIIFSHLHFDHSGATAEFPNARIIVQRDEWQAGTDSKYVEMGIYHPGDFDLGHDVQQVQGEFDVFGDGSIVCIPTPGHTAGHQSLRVELPSGAVLLVGDCCYFEKMLEPLLMPPMAFDRDMQQSSMKKLIDIHASGVRLLFAHDREQWLALGGAPIS